MASSSAAAIACHYQPRAKEDTDSRDVVGDDAKCAICLDEYIESSSPAQQLELCRHQFHAACLKTWLSTSPHQTCPICRSPIGDNDMCDRQIRFDGEPHLIAFVFEITLILVAAIMSTPVFYCIYKS